MKYIFFCVWLICIGASNSLAQIRFHLPDSNASWNIASGMTNGNVTFKSYGIIGDTIMLGNIYKKLGESSDTDFVVSNSNYFCAVREQNGKWLFIKKDSSIEQLLYDFNLNKGDTMRIDNSCWWGTGVRKYVVTATDSIYIDGSYRRRMQIMPGEDIIEGIGSSYGLFYPVCSLQDAGYRLLCYHQNGRLVYMPNPDSNCYNINMGISQSDDASTIRIFPNPTVENIHLSCGRRGDGFKTIIYSIQGVEILQQKLISQESDIDLRLLPSGIYMLRVMKNETPIVTKKLIKY